MHRVLVFGAVFLSSACVPKAFEVENWENSATGSEASRDVDSYECMKENTSFKRRSSSGSGGYSASAGDEVDMQLYSACMRARGYELKDRAPSEAGLALGDYVSAAPEPGSVVLAASVGHGGAVSNYAYLSLDDVERRVFSTKAELRDWNAMRFGLGASYQPGRLVEVGARLEVRRVLSRSEFGYSGEDYDVPWVELPDQWAPYATVSGRVRLPMMPRLSASGGVGAGYIPALDVPDFVITGMQTSEDGTEVPFDQTVISDDRAATLRPFLRAGVSYDILFAKPHGVRVGCGVERPFAEREWMRGDCSVAYRFSPGSAN